jgi:hypothetical protein
MKAKNWLGIAIMAIGVYLWYLLNGIAPVNCTGWNLINPLCYINAGMYILAKMLAIIVLTAGFVVGVMTMFMTESNWKTLTAAIVLIILTIVLVAATPGIPDEWFTGIASIIVGYLGVTKQDKEVVKGFQF